ncbi:MAG: Asp-tRNA(Asn)/Glu-tRNA(Gln) amidotransferase subunit GatC [Acidobacteriaceae bacterium]
MTTKSDKVSAEDVRHVADLANLELTVHEEQAMIRDLNAILGHLEQLNELDVTDVQPMAQVSEVLGKHEALGIDAEARSALRSDKVEECLPRSIVMNNAPETDGAFFKVPRVMER